MKKWAEQNGLSELYDQYLTACEKIAEECENESYPANGSNYDLRVELIQKNYPELFA